MTRSTAPIAATPSRGPVGSWRPEAAALQRPVVLGPVQVEVVAQDRQQQADAGRGEGRHEESRRPARRRPARRRPPIWARLSPVPDRLVLRPRPSRRPAGAGGRTACAFEPRPSGDQGGSITPLLSDNQSKRPRLCQHRLRPCLEPGGSPRDAACAAHSSLPRRRARAGRARGDLRRHHRCGGRHPTHPRSARCGGRQRARRRSARSASSCGWPPTRPRCSAATAAARPRPGRSSAAGWPPPSNCRGRPGPC